MRESGHIAPQIVEALVKYLAGAVSSSGIETVLGHGDYRLLDEERDGILGLHVPLPSVLVAVQPEEGEPATFNCTVTVRHSAEQSTLTAHNADARAVIEACLTTDAITVAITESVTGPFQINSHSHSGGRFQLNGRAYETTVEFTISAA